MNAASPSALPPMHPGVPQPPAQPTSGNVAPIVGGEIQLPAQQPNASTQSDLQKEANEVATLCLIKLQKYITSSKNEPLNERIAFPSVGMRRLIKKIDKVSIAISTGESSAHNALITLKGALGEFKAEQTKYNFKKEQIALYIIKINQYIEQINKYNLLIDKNRNPLPGKENEAAQLYKVLDGLKLELDHIKDLLTSLPDVDRAFLQDKIEFNSTTNRIQPKGYLGRTPSHLTPKVLKKISAVASQNIGDTVPVTHDDNKEVRFNVTKEQSGDVRIVQIGAKLGEGSWGVVSESLSIIEGKEGAYKQAITGRGAIGDKRAVEDLRKEYDISNKLHDLGFGYGLLPRPWKFTYLKTGDVGLESKKFFSNYADKFFRDEKSTYAAFHQLISGLHSLSSCNILHRDIKSANMLLDADGRVCLADMGGVVDAGKVNLDKKDLRGIFRAQEFSTPEILCSKDLDKLKELELRYVSCSTRYHSSKNPKERKELKAILKESIEFGKKMDVFALGMALYERFVTHLFEHDKKSRMTSPYYLAYLDSGVDRNKLSLADRRPDVSEAYDDIEHLSSNEPTHQALNALIKKMVDPESNSRPAPDAVLTEFEEIMRQDKNGQALMELFDQNRIRFAN